MFGRGEEELHRQMIVEHYKYLGSPPEHMWAGPEGTLIKIQRDCLHLAAKMDRRPIRRTLERHVAGEPLATHGGGRQLGCMLGHRVSTPRRSGDRAPRSGCSGVGRARRVRATRRRHLVRRRARQQGERGGYGETGRKARRARGRSQNSGRRRLASRTIVLALFVSVLAAHMPVAVASS